MENINFESVMFYSTPESPEYMEYDIMDGPYLQGSCSPTIREILHTLDTKITLDDLCADLDFFEEDMTATPQPHSDHDYTSVPVADNEVTISDDIILDCFNEYSDQSYDLVQEIVIGSTDLEQKLQDVAEVLEREIFRSSSMSPSLTESEMSSTCSEASSARSKRGRPRKSPEIHKMKLQKPISKEKAKVIRNNMSSMKYRHKKSDEKLSIAQQLTVAINENEKLTAKSTKLERDIDLLRLWVSSF